MKSGKRFQGGIFCVIPMGMIYDESLRKAVSRRFYRYFSVDAEELRSMTLIQGILYEIQKLVDKEMQTQKYANYMSMRQPESSDNMSVRRRNIHFNALLEEVENSYGYAVYHNGRQLFFNTAGFSKDSEGTARLKEFFSLNKDNLPGVGTASSYNQNNWQIVIAVAALIAARLESKTAYPDNMYKGYGKTVLLYWAQEIANKVRSAFHRTNLPVRYGYILSRKGYEGQVYKSDVISIV